MFFTLNRSALQLNMLAYLEHVLHAEPLHTSAKHAFASLSMFFTLNRSTLQLNMLSCLSMFFTLNCSTLQLNILAYLEHVFHAEPLHTSAKHTLDRLFCLVVQRRHQIGEPFSLNDDV